MKNLLYCALAFCFNAHLFASDDACIQNLEDCYHKGKNIVNKIEHAKDMDQKEYLKKKASSKFHIGCKHGHSKSCKEYNNLKKLKKVTHSK